MSYLPAQMSEGTMSWGPLLTLWTIRLSLLLYVVVLATQLYPCGRGRWEPLRRWLWTAGCALFLVHVACAFHFYHDWSHTAAVAETARQTGEVLGTEFGQGIYFSYAFTVVWILDVAWWWGGLETYRRRSPIVSTAIHAYLLAIAFNGAVVFESGPTRPAGLAACLGLGLLLLVPTLKKTTLKRPPRPGTDSGTQ